MSEPTPANKFSYLQIAENHFNESIPLKDRTITDGSITSFQDWKIYFKDWYYPEDKFIYYYFPQKQQQSVVQQSIDFCLILAAINGEI